MIFVGPLLALAVTVFGLGSAHSGCHEGDEFALLHFNDFHGQLEPESGAEGGKSLGGIARLATAIGQIRAEQPTRPSVLLFGGDLLQGTVTSSLFQGIPDVALFGRLGVDAAVVGNHEFDYGQGVFRHLAQRADFPLLAANIRGIDRPLPVASSAMLARSGGLKIAVLGLTTPELATSTHPKNVVGIEVEDPVDVADRLVPKLREQSDMVVVLSHLGLLDDRRLAREVEGIDLIVGGHNHHVLGQPVMEDDVPIVQAGERGRWLGRIDCVCQNGRMKKLAYHLIPIDDRITPEPQMAEEVQRIVASAVSELTEVIGTAPVELSADRELIRREEALLGDFVADIAREVTGADVALFNGGGFRATIPAGQVTLKHIYQTFPFRNELVVGRLSGAQLLDVLALAASLNPADNPGGFLQVSGLRYRIGGRRLESVTIDGKRVDPARGYKVVVPDFLAAGGDGYGLIAQMSDRVMTGRLISDMLIEAFRSGMKANVKLDGRISRARP